MNRRQFGRLINKLRQSTVWIRSRKGRPRRLALEDHLLLTVA
ncbi:hypothetical protein QOM21_00775 [Streptomyces sp. Pv4-95]